MKSRILVLDSGALFKQDISHLQSHAQAFYTIPEVVDEIKDPVSKARWETLSSILSIKVTRPTLEAFKHVSEFSKKTGDSAVLSRTDLKVLALTWMLHSTAPELEQEDQVPSEEEEELDDDDGWITPANIHKLKGVKKDAIVPVACVTTDFAMQNVLLQLKCHLMSINGLQINQVKTWALRCHACFKITKNMEKKFCPSCGGATLIRVSMGVKKGKEIVYLKKNFQYNNRGQVYDVPKESKLILCEDQKEYAKALKEKKWFDKKINDDSVDFFDSKRLTVNGQIIVGHGKRNVNEVRGRRRK